MEDETIPAESVDGGGELAPLIDRVRQYVDQSVSENTKRAYAADWRHFTGWCNREGLETLPASPRTIAAYIAAMADGSAAEDDQPYAAATIQHRLAALRVVHGAQGHADPTDDELVDKTWSGIRRDDGVDVDGEGREALLAHHIREMVDALADDLKGARDRALMLVGYATGARRSELAALDVADLDFRPEGVVVRIRQSKTDQEGRGRIASVDYGDEYCPIEGLEAWLEAADLEEGPVFRSVDRWSNVGGRLSGRSINRAVKSAADLDASQIGAHSLRAGHVTQRKVAGDSDGAIMEQTGHSSESTMRRYDRRAKEFRHEVSESLGL